MKTLIDKMERWENSEGTVLLWQLMKLKSNINEIDTI